MDGSPIAVGAKTLPTSGKNPCRIPAQNAGRIERMLDRLDAASPPDDMNVPGYRFHRLKGDQADRYAVSITGNLRITFGFDGEDAIDIDIEDYH